VYKRQNLKWKKGINNTSSDLIGQLELFNRARKIKSEKKLKENGIHVQKWTKALETYEKLWSQIGIIYPSVKRSEETCNKAHVLLACIYGMRTNVYKASSGQIYGDPVIRKIGRHSNTTPYYSGWVVGLPFDLEIMTDYGTKMLHLLTMVTHVTDHQLAKVGATKHHSIKSYRYIPEQGLIIMSVGSKEKVMQWKDIVATHSKNECDNIRQQLIMQQFEAATHKRDGHLKRFCLGNSTKPGKLFNPAQFGEDPITRAPLYAFPAAVYNPATSKTYLEHFISEAARDHVLSQMMIQ